MFLGLYSPTSTLLISTAFTTAYVSSIYLFPASRVTSSSKSTTLSATQPLASDTTTPPTSLLRESRDRNHPSVIKARLLAVSIASALSCSSIPLLLHYHPPKLLNASSLRLLGLSIPSTLSSLVKLIAYPLGLTASLFFGSIYVSYLDGSLLPGQRWFSWTGLRQQFFCLQGIRNYLVGPLTEELVFRSSIVAVSSLGGLSRNQIIFLSPLYFGIAHIHHAYETYIGQGRTKQALINGIASSTFQFVYTTLFGWYATFIFMRTGSVVPPFLIHTFCNWFGLPPVLQAIKVYPKKKIPIIASYLIGITTFVYGFSKWTRPEFFGGSYYW